VLGSKNWGTGSELGPKIFLLDSGLSFLRRTSHGVDGLAVDCGTSDRGSQRVITRYFLLDRPKDQDETKEDGPKSEASPSPQQTTVVIGSVF
jgi:hypothetical protein